jgi:hypothetical protein
MHPYSSFDLPRYEKLIGIVGGMSALYSESDTAFIHSRFVERLFVYLTGARDLSRMDNSFDAILNGTQGVGIKTFVVGQKAVDSVEKVAEFTRNASQGDFNDLSREDLAHLVASMRNARISSVNADFALDSTNPFYHCLVRVPGGAKVHEEPYASIDIDRIQPTDPRGSAIQRFSSGKSGHVHFTDGERKYMFNSAKNVLYQRFELNKFYNSPFMQISIETDILSRLEREMGQSIQQAIASGLDTTESKQGLTVESVVLPLYSTKYAGRVVSPKSGINQWNAGGRIRSFGESYIPVPIDVHKKVPGFFPPREQKFSLRLPTGKIIKAKICQGNDKALMADPNTDLCEWLYSVIDGDYRIAEKRLEQQRPYTYTDLSFIGKDSVKISKVPDVPGLYELESMPLGSYEEFLADEPEMKDQND